MRAGNDFTQCRTGRGLAASRRPFGDARLPVRHCATGAEVPPRHQTTQPKNEVLTSNRDLTKCIVTYSDGSTEEKLVGDYQIVAVNLKHKDCE